MVIINPEEEPSINTFFPDELQNGASRKLSTS